MTVREMFAGVFREKEAGQVEFSLETEVLVCGIGSAGSYAALAAAHEGATVIALEKNVNIGGTSIVGKVAKHYYGMGGGVWEEIETEALQSEPLFIAPKNYTDAKQAVLTEKLLSAGVRVLADAWVTGVYFEENRAVGVRALIGGKEISIRSKILIDSTGDGDILRLCGVCGMVGREIDGKTVPFTVRTEFMSEKGFVSLNSDSGYLDQYDPADFTRGTLAAHARFSGRMRREENVRLISLAAMTGVREGMRFEGEEFLRYPAVLAGKKPTDPLLYVMSDLDKHGHDLALDEEEYQDFWCICNLSTVTIRFALPRGVVVPKGIAGLLSCCRCLSLDSTLSSAVRMNRDMYRLGECVGLGAALAVKAGCDFLEVPYAGYRALAEAKNCFAGDADRAEFAFDHPRGDPNYPYCPVELDLPDDALLAGLASTRPGVAMWSVKRRGKAAIPLLEKALSTASDADFRKNIAIALGLCGAKSALPVLREIFHGRDDYFYNEWRRSNQFRSAIAVCLIGRIGTAEDEAMLRDFLFDFTEPEKPFYHELPPDNLYWKRQGVNALYFQLFTHAAMACIKIRRRLGLPMAPLHEAFLEHFTGENADRIVKAVSVYPESDPDTQEICHFLSLALRFTQ